jgi:DNA polymerase I-like protein with 3'-5' exonuclease and polymerase domains
MHSFVASKIYPELQGKSLKEIKDRYPEKRKIAKTAGFALNYGGNGATVAQNVGIPEEEGNYVYDAYFQEFKGVKQYFDKVKKAALDTGYIIFNQRVNSKSFIPRYNEFLELKKQVSAPGFWNVYRDEKQLDSDLFRNSLKPLVRSYFKRKGEIERRAINYPIQGSGAEMTKFACIDIFNKLKAADLLFEVWFCNVIHDEVLLEANRNVAFQVSKIVTESMKTAGNYFCKIVKFDTDGKLPIKAELTSWWRH